MSPPFAALALFIILYVLAFSPVLDGRDVGFKAHVSAGVQIGQWRATTEGSWSVPVRFQACCRDNVSRICKLLAPSHVRDGGAYEIEVILLSVPSAARSWSVSSPSLRRC